MDSLKDSLKEVESYFSEQLETRERLLRESRDVISSCSRAIIDVHNGKFPEAEKEIKSARKLLDPLKKSRDSVLSRYLISPETELVEASCVLALVKGRPVPAREVLGASPEAYLHGLLDTVGELKRLVLDSIMKGDLSSARRHFDSMQQLYSSCSPLAVYDHVVNGTRRKIDVARMLVEDTRGIITEEIRRESVESSMRRLDKMLRRARGH
jgi:translin